MLALVLVWLSTGADAIESGHSAIWYDPDRDGEGWVLEILEEDLAVTYWYTYDESGNQRWLGGAGQVLEDAEGAYIDFPELFIASGGRFGDQFDPDDVVLQAVGRATFRFDDCENGVVEFEALGTSGQTPITRLTNTMGAGCWPRNGVPGLPVRSFAGQSGSWFDVTHDGEGFTLQWLADGRAVVYWFSYDSEGNQAWMGGVGELIGDDIVFEELLQTRGARFGDAFNPADVELFPWGQMTLSLTCDEGTVHYESTIPEFGEGNQSLSRLTRLMRPDCPYEKPSITDLYDFTWNEIPIDEDPPGAGQTGQSAIKLADNGAIIGSIGFRPEGFSVGVIWRPDIGEWEQMGDLAIRGGEDSLWISRDGQLVLGEEDTEPSAARVPVFWSEESGWLPMPDAVFFDNLSTGASDNLGIVVGVGEHQGDARGYPWIWTLEDGAWELPQTEAIRGAWPLDVSMDGSRIVGYAGRRGASTVTPDFFGIMWEEFGEPVTFTDDFGAELSIARTCNTDCSIIAGSSQTLFLPHHPNSGQAWYWTEEGTIGYMGSLPDAWEFTPWPYVPTDMSRDGSIVIGGYAVVVPGNQLRGRSFLWTEATGIVSILGIAEEIGIGDDNWRSMTPYSITSDGSRILLTGTKRTSFSQPNQKRAVVLELTPKSE